jgi:Phage tail tube protein
MPTPIAGNQADLGVALQSAQGVVVAAPQHRVPLVGGAVMGRKDTADVAETTAARVISDSFVTQVRGDGAPAFWVRDNAIGLFLYAAMGTKAVAGAGDPFTHTFTLASLLPYLTMWQRVGPVAAGGRYEKFVDCKVTQLVLASAAGGRLDCTATIVGITPRFRLAADVAVAMESGPGYVHGHGVGALKVEGAALSTIEDITVTINNGGGLQQGDSITGYAIAEGLLDISIATTELVEDFALYNRFMYGTAAPADLAVPVATILEGGGAPAGIDFKWTRIGAAPGPERSLEILAPRVQIQPAPAEPNTSGDPLKRNVTYKAVQPAGGVSAISAILKNGLASYPVAP